MRTAKKSLLCILLVAGIAGCSKKNEDYKSFVENGEIVYPGIISKTGFMPGKLRATLTWSPSPDPNVVRYLIYWNNKSDSLSVNAVSHDPRDTVKVVIPSLNEYVYSFTVYCYDAKGNKSIPVDINNVKVFGTVYEGGLLNRGYNADKPYEVNEDGSVRLFFNTPDTINIATYVDFEDNTGAAKRAVLKPDDLSVLLPDYKANTPILYRSAYIPVRSATDTFYVTERDTFPTVIKPVLVDKANFKSMKLPGDVSDAWGWVMTAAWDGVTNADYGFHSADATFPTSFTFDMGVSVSLLNFKMWQRYSGLYNYGNLENFEVWGSNNPNTDGSWDSWTKLGTFTNVKPSGSPVGTNTDADRAMGQAGDRYTFSAPTQNVRYIRFKVIKTWGNTNYFHFQELSMYRK